LVEKKRRDRINNYLGELHELLTETDKSTPSSKLEKADILQMAVHHIRKLKQKLRAKVLGECSIEYIAYSWLYIKYTITV